jgi:glutamyl-tRNA synthetase
MSAPATTSISRELKQARLPAPAATSPVETNLELWQKMLDHGFKEGEASVRIKTDLSNPDPAMRDFPAFRILDAPPTRR